MKAIGLRSGLLSIAWILLIWLVFIPPVLGAEVNNLQAAIDEYMNATVKTGRFNGSILVAQKGEVMVKKGYGTANFEWQIPNSSETIFRLGSVTKQFCAACIMQLEEKGLLSLNDQLQKYIPDYPQGNIITIHHLLTHTSGIPNFTNFPDYISTMMIPSPPEKTIDRFKNLPLEFQPGEKFAYSNSNYVLLGFILEKVSGQSFENYLQENILKPLHMEHTGYDHPEKILPNRASGYDASSEGLINTPYIDTSIPHAAGAMYSTVEDM
jgi:CubicO group peptidase (beta-lactamase class C family)